MTASAAPTLTQAGSGGATWPAVFDGIGALVVRCDLDPAALVAKIRRHSPGLSWLAVKVTGADASPTLDIDHCWHVWEQLGLEVGAWVYCDGPPDHDTFAVRGFPWARFWVYDVEAEYKSDEGGHYEWAAQLVASHAAQITPALPAAVTSYGGYKTSIDFGAFARAGWPILAQVYDSFSDGDEWTYVRGSDLRGPSYCGPYPTDGVHRLTRRLKLSPGEAVYRPESID